jgi:ribonuclease HI
MINSLKWNVDGSSLGKPGPSGIDGVLQNHHGHLLGMFSVPVGILDSNIAELRVIVKAIELSASNCLLHHQHLIIESDSANVISWMHKPHIRPWKHHNLFSSVNRLNAFFGSITFVAREMCRGDRPPTLNCVWVWKIWGDKEFLSLISGKNRMGVAT